MTRLSCQNLCLGYDGKEILHNLNFQVESGDYLCIIGENGSGKSTLMKTILGLQKPLSGTIQNGFSPSETGYLPQETAVQKDFPATVKEIVLSGFQGHSGPFYTREEKRLAAVNIEKMGITPLTRHCWRELSGGQQQRVLFARALCATRKMLLLDEPVSGLDPQVTADMYQIIEDLHKDGITIIMISHDISAVKQHATHILRLGGSPFFGTKQKYLNGGEA